MLLAGPPGIGKTTVANSSTKLGVDVYVINGSDNEIPRYCQCEELRFDRLAYMQVSKHQYHHR